MDFAFDEAQEAIRGLAKKIISELVTDKSLCAVELDGQWFHRKLWQELARAQLLGIAVPESFGGSGMGLVELCLLLQQVGRNVAPVPVAPTLVLGALAVAEFGTAAQRQALLPGVVTGTTILTAALADTDSLSPINPRTAARRGPSGWILEGERNFVPAAHLAHRVLVPAMTPDGVAVFLVDPNAAGVTMARQMTSSGEPLSRLSLANVEVSESDVLGSTENGAQITGWIAERSVLAQCALLLGVAEKALRLTAEYSGERKQFGVPIGSFQAVSQRCGDAYIDIAAMRVTLWQAAWRLSQGLPAARELAIAKFWAADGSHRVVTAAQHIHGGTGFDRDYPLFRYTLWAKQLEFTMGGANAQLAFLGHRIAAEARPSEVS